MTILLALGMNIGLIYLKTFFGFNDQWTYKRVIFHLILSYTVLGGGFILFLIRELSKRKPWLLPCYSVLWNIHDYNAYCPTCKEMFSAGAMADTMRCGQHGDLLLRDKNGCPVGYGEARKKIEEYIKNNKKKLLKEYILPF
jgi:hypothetical protein